MSILSDIADALEESAAHWQKEAHRFDDSAHRLIHLDPDKGQDGPLAYTMACRIHAIHDQHLAGLLRVKDLRTV